VTTVTDGVMASAMSHGAVIAIVIEIETGGRALVPGLSLSVSISISI
jgi:hypothetical protein